MNLARPSPEQMFMGEGAKLVRVAVQLTKQKKASDMIFIDELDAVGTKRHDPGKAAITRRSEPCWSS